jgi:NADH dehydrogenase
MDKKIVIVGGGAGGLELASKLGRILGPARVTLVDSRLSHIWKPSLHEVAAGTLDIHAEGLSYQMLAHDNGFTFVYGALTALDSAAKTLTVAAVLSDTGEIIIPERNLGFDKLVLALGSTANYFGVPGAAEHTVSLNATEDAERFRLKMLKLLTAAELQKEHNPLARVNVVIIGGGATGVELAAELREASAVHASYGYRKLDPNRDITITILEGAARVLAPLPERVSAAAAKLLGERHVTVKTQCRVVNITARQVEDNAGGVYPADVCVWAAGIKAPALLASLGLPVNKSGQVVVDPHLQVNGPESGIYAIGDCAVCVDGAGTAVSPRAQAAHQQADYLCRKLSRDALGKPAEQKPFIFKEHGSLVSVGSQTSVGSLMGALQGAGWFVEGTFARLMYVSLHLMHHQAVLGTMRTAVLALARFLIKRSTPLVKLH